MPDTRIWSRCRSVAEAAGDDNRCTEDVVVLAVVDDHLADVDADTNSHRIGMPTTRHASIVLLHGDRRAHAVVGRLEDRHHAVTERLRHPATEAADDVTERAQVGADLRPLRGRLHRLRAATSIRRCR